MRNAELQKWLECAKASTHEWDRVRVEYVGMFAWLRNLLESIAENDTEKLEATLSVKPFELYVDINPAELAKMAEVTALFKNVDVNVLKAILIKYKNMFHGVSGLLEQFIIGFQCLLLFQPEFNGLLLHIISQYLWLFSLILQGLP